jgi:hypothetical protein
VKKTNVSKTISVLVLRVLISILRRPKSNRKLSLFLTKYNVMKAYGGLEVYLHAFLTSALDGGEWSASRAGSFTYKDCHWIRGSAGPRVGLVAVEKRKIIPSRPLPGIESRPSSP